MAKQKCPSVTSLRLFNDGQLSIADIELIGNHLESCAGCLARLESLEPGSLELGMVGAVVDDRPEGNDVAKLDQNARVILEEISPDDTPTIESYHGCDLYSLEALVGKTGLGDKYDAYDLVMERPVTVIIPQASAISSVDHRSQFIQDASFASSLRHENILHINQFGTWDEENCYLTMPKLMSCPLDVVLKSDQHFSLQAVLLVVGQVCQALKFAHRYNVIHRHLNPSNIFVSDELHVLVSEFGLTIDGRYQFGLIQPMHESTQYNSPEAKSNDPARIDLRTDIYSVGALLGVLLNRVKDADEENIKSLERVATKCQRISRRRRFQSVDQLVEHIGDTFVV